MRAFAAYVHAQQGDVPPADASPDTWADLRGEMIADLPTCGRRFFEAVMMGVVRGELRGKMIVAGDWVAVMDIARLRSFLDEFPPKFGRDQVAKLAELPGDHPCVVHLSEF